MKSIPFAFHVVVGNGDGENPNTSIAATTDRMVELRGYRLSLPPVSVVSGAAIVTFGGVLNSTQPGGGEPGGDGFDVMFMPSTTESSFFSIDFPEGCVMSDEAMNISMALHENENYEGASIAYWGRLVPRR